MLRLAASLFLFSLASSAQADPARFAALKRGKDAYTLRCASCHGVWMDGEGWDSRAPNLRGYAKSDSDFAAASRHVEGIPPDTAKDVVLWIRNYDRPHPWREGKEETYEARLFRFNCGQCHGNTGEGDGTAARALSPRPTAFTSGVFKFKSTLWGTPPTQGDLARTIARGVPGTAMPAWQGRLDEDEISELAAIVLSFSTPTAAAMPLEEGTPPAVDKNLIARGRGLYEKHGCAVCHGASGKGDGESARDLPLAPRDFSRPELFKGGSALADVRRSIRTGFDGTPMESYDRVLSEAESWALAAFVLSLK